MEYNKQFRACQHRKVPNFWTSDQSVYICLQFCGNSISCHPAFHVVHTSLWRGCSMLCFEQAQFIEGYSEEAYKYKTCPLQAKGQITNFLRQGIFHWDVTHLVLSSFIWLFISLIYEVALIHLMLGKLQF